MDVGQTVDLSSWPGRFDSFHPHHTLLRWPNWQRRQVESLNVAGSNPALSTIRFRSPTRQRQRSQKPSRSGFDSQRNHHGEVTEPGKVPGCYPEAGGARRREGSSPSLSASRSATMGL